jgi:hypothetical protein
LLSEQERLRQAYERGGAGRRRATAGATRVLEYKRKGADGTRRIIAMFASRRRHLYVHVDGEGAGRVYMQGKFPATKKTPVSYEEAEQCLRRWQEGGVSFKGGPRYELDRILLQRLICV